MIPPKISLALAGGGVLLLLACVSHYIGFEAGYAKRAGEEATRDSARKDVVVESGAAVLKHERARRQVLHEVDRETQNKLDLLAADRERARAAVSGLRQQLDRVRADAMSSEATIAGLADQLSAATNGLSECSERYSAVAAEHDRLAIQVAGLLAAYE